jgi:hypothetical protein
VSAECAPAGVFRPENQGRRFGVDSSQNQGVYFVHEGVLYVETESDASYTKVLDDTTRSVMDTTGLYEQLAEHLNQA